MVPQLGLSRTASGLRAGVVPVVLVVLITGLVVMLTGAAAALLVGCVAAGFGLTHLCGLPLTFEERLAFGAVIGALTLAVVILAAAMLFGLRGDTVMGALGVTLAVAAPGWWKARARLRGDLVEAAGRWRRLQPWPLLLLLAAAWPYTLVILGRAYDFTGQGLVVGNVGVYADWAAHLTYAGSFAYGANFPPQFPIDPGHRLAYPFLVDLLAAATVPLGTSLTSALVLSSGLLGLAFPAVMYLAAVRLIGSRGGAALAVLVFALGGGLGFVLLFGDVGRSGLGALAHLPRLYTQDAGRNLVWLNPVLAWMLPQRSVLFGFSLALIVMAVLWIALEAPRTTTAAASWTPFAFAGIVAGLTPLAHLHAYGTVVVLAGFWALFSPRREWAAFFAPALLLGLPQALWMASAGAAQLRWQLGWLAGPGGHAGGPVLFWLENTGLLIPAMLAAFLWRRLMPARVAVCLAPIWLWFVVPNLAVFQPWDWDNTKFFAYWALFGAMPVGALLARLLTMGAWARIAGAALAVGLTVSGGLDLARSLDPTVSSARFTDAGGVQAAAWVRANTSPTAIFLVAPDHNEPIPTLGGRRVMAGYPGWMWTYGLPDWVARTNDAQRMLQGGPQTPELLRRYGVDYVVVGPQETGQFGASTAYWDRAATRVYSDGPYGIYRVDRSRA